MEYYDSINKFDLYKFYFDKSNTLLQNGQVISVLDKNCLNFKDEQDFKLFKDNPYQTAKTDGIRKNSLENKERRKSSVHYQMALTEASENEFNPRKVMTLGYFNKKVE